MRSNYEEDLPKFMSKMDKLLMSNDSDSGYFVGDEVIHYLLHKFNAI